MNAKVSFLVVTSLLATFGMVQPVQAAATGATSDSSSSSSTSNSAAVSSSSSSNATSQAPNVKGHTDVEVKLSNNYGKRSKDPWNPNNPHIPADPDKQVSNGAKPGGGLSLVYVTNQLVFESTNIMFGSETEVPTNKDYSGFWKVNNQPKFVVEVWDGRATHEGWHLNVKAAPLMVDNKVIEGATIHFDKPTLSAVDGDSKVTANVADINVEDKDQTLLNAESANGDDWTTAQYDVENIKMIIPEKSAQEGTFTTKLTWDLVSGPVK